MITFSILGCSVLRDIFRLNPNKKYKVDKFIQFVSPLSLADGADLKDRNIVDPIVEFEKTDWHSFAKKCVGIDINKNGLKLINDSNSDYLLIDLTELRFNLISVSSKGKTFNVTQTKFTNLIMENKKKFPSFKKATFTVLDYDEQFVQKQLSIYINFLKKKYNPKNIILIKNYLAYKTLDNNSVINYLPSYINVINSRLEKAYSYFEENFKNINIIDVPVGALGDANHTWGNDPLHFESQYYTYLYNCIEVIVSRKLNKVKKLLKLKDFYSEYCNYKELYERQKNNKYICKMNLLKDPCDFSSKQWLITSSNGSSFNPTNYQITTGSAKLSYVLIKQQIPNCYVGNTLTLSLKHLALSEGSIFGFGLAARIDGKLTFLDSVEITKRQSKVNWITCNIDLSFKDKELYFYVICRNPNCTFKLSEAKMEIGRNSTLY